ncbi:glycosyltransferase [Humibacillus xanthopallidus]|uniref:MGT family glycosyltransferase n=1 Tax=Humibacillus xanthopallidus TaxID=412689 RepID=A0A543H8T2_9MICO|nr:glycosyltransferase [Humibacillus xanthopallidus]TQM54639.1 MGT family glycosyltransferase [Humibacillus xanthopallidus]
MTLLVISPDYASHLYPLVTLATAWHEAGERVVVATGPATSGIVRDFGLERVDLRLGRGSNPGVIRAEEQPKGEDDSLRGFFDATRRGAVETLAFQAEARGDDLLWDPVTVARDVQRIVAQVRPDHVIVDHLAFSARLALASSGVHHADVVLGHPSALTVGDEVYGFPPAFPRAIVPDPAALADLHRLCVKVRDSFTAQWNSALETLAPGCTPSVDAFAETGDVVLLNYPGELHDAERTALLPPHAFLGSAVRTEARDPQVEDWLSESAEPIAYVSLGSFLSVRSDVLARVAEALRHIDIRVAFALGSTPREALGELPASWLVRETLPQVRLLGRSALAVSHGGNNSVTEALTSAVPLLLLPLSTDQFAGAAAIEQAGIGEALDPNAATSDEIAAAAARLLALEGLGRERLDRIGADLVRTPGAQRAHAILS